MTVEKDHEGEPLVVRVRDDPEAEKIARTIKRLSPELYCIGCGHRDYALLEEPGSGIRSCFFRRRESRSLGVLTPAYPVEIPHTVATLMCTNCGRIEQFSDGILKQMAEPEEYGHDVRPEGEEF